MPAVARLTAEPCEAAMNPAITLFGNLVRHHPMHPQLGPRMQPRMERFKRWWRAPPTIKDRLLGAIVGAFAGFWLGLLSSASLGPPALSPVQFIGLITAACVLAGALFPKTATVVLFPFGVTGGGL